MSPVRSLLAIGLLVTWTGCLSMPDLDEAAVIDGQTCNAGTARSTVALIGPTGCSGTLIGDRLIMTARHCLYEDGGSTDDPVSDCNSDGTPNPATWFSEPSFTTDVYVGTVSSGPAIARARVLTDVGSGGAPCNGDVAFLALDRSLPGMTPVAVSTTPVTNPLTGEPPYLLAGYGSTIDTIFPESSETCQQKSVSIVSANDDILGKSGTREAWSGDFKVYYGTDEFVYSKGSCYGDSGGPIYRLDAGGNILSVAGVVSRFRDGDVCDGNTIAADVALKSDWIEAARQSASQLAGSYQNLPIPGRGPAMESYPDIWERWESTTDENFELILGDPVAPVQEWSGVFAIRAARQDFADGTIVWNPLVAQAEVTHLPEAAFLPTEVMAIYSDSATRTCLG